jgi:hypothetical protein
MGQVHTYRVLIYEQHLCVGLNLTQKLGMADIRKDSYNQYLVKGA